MTHLRKMMLEELQRRNYAETTIETMKTLKREEVYARDYRDLGHLLESVEGFIENYYNRCRLHSALGYRPPEEFENESEDRVGDARFGAATMRVFKTLTRTQS